MSSLHATAVSAVCDVPDQTDSTELYVLPIVSMFASPFPVGATLYQIVFERPVTNGIRGSCAQAGVGSFASGVAPELSLVSEKDVDAMFMAFAKLSFAGAGAITVKVGRVTVPVVKVVPPPGGGFWTPTEFVLPKVAINAAGTVAVSCVALTNVVAMALPLLSGFRITLEVEPKFVPVIVITLSADFTSALVGETDVIVGAVPSTEKVSGLLITGPTVTVI